ncbi:hypothetical protein BXZ70DRAFT_895131 [Cristinia sonorae]|uniref:FAS1 domain-containing protein n=1 Tax=Cristinia sonorae TaxID=1940300 RepID=A0A8K0XNU5_9AGAR|nr:hypothetical protein BXZ70DRAFT_895131 [Cristinia sonorae]
MHLWHCFPLPLLALVPLSLAAQVPFIHRNISTTSTNLVDALSADPDYTSLLALLQRAKLIPTLNKLNGSTLFAPTNDAIERHKERNSLWAAALLADDSAPLRDNVQEALRQELFYHLLNYTIPGPPGGQTPDVLFTLHYPRKSTSGPPSHEPPPYPPWLPVPGGTLGGEPQRLRIATRNGKSYTGVDSSGNGGAEIVKSPIETSNGLLLGLGDVLEVPPDLATIIQRHPQLTYLSKILNEETTRFLNGTPELTLFLPVDSAWQGLPHYERLYLESNLGSDDLTRIVNMHAVHRKSVKYSESFTAGLNVTTVDGPTLEISVTPDNKTMVSTAELVESDIYASNGVLHTVSSLLIPEGALKVTPEKYLILYDCSQFVRLLHSVNLTSLINDTETHWTILAPQDDVMAILDNGSLPESGTDELKKMLQYHFIPGKQTQKKLKDGMLSETALEEPGLDGGRQVLGVEVTESRKKGEDKSVRFGGASTIGEPLEIDNTLIYFVSRPLTPPEDVLTTALPSLDLSVFLAAVFATNLADTLKLTPRTTPLIPQNPAFKRLGMLVSSHLLAASSKPDLEKVIQHHVLNSVVYAQEWRNGSQRTFSTLEGSDVHLERNANDNGTLLLSASGGWADMHAQLHIKNALTQTGVIHEVSDVLIPRSVNLTVGKLVRAAKGSTMATMVVKAGLDWVLNGTAPPEGSQWADQGLGEAGWTLLCPSDDAFKNIKLTELYADEERLRDIVTQHLVPLQTPKEDIPKNVFDNVLNNRPLILDDEATYTTLLSSSSLYGDVVFRVESDGKTVVGIKGARGDNGKRDWAHVVAWGRSTTGGGTGGVIEIDRLLIPYSPSWWNAYGAPIGVGVVGVGMIGLFFYAVRLVWRRDTTEATYEPSDASSSDEATAPTTNSSSTADSVKSFVAGGVGGIAAVLVGHPFDLTKTRLQTAAPGTYTGAIHVVKTTLARDGATGLYRGVVPPLLGVTPIFAVSFWAYDMSKLLIYKVTPNRTSQQFSVAEYAAAGFLSAIPTTLVTAPVERAKVLLQVQGQGQGGTQYKGVIDVVRHLYKEGGVRSVFRGSFATVMRDGPGSAAYFAAYEVTKKFLTPAGGSPSDLNLGAVILAGGTAGVAMWSIAIPPDVLKSRIQSAPTGTYSGFLDCARKTIAADGVTALWRGLGPAMARAFPANAATFLGVELAKQTMNKYF